MGSRDLKECGRDCRGARFVSRRYGLMKDDYKFSLGARVKTPAGDRGVVEHLGRAQGRRMYSVRTEEGSHWFEESELLPDVAGD